MVMKERSNPATEQQLITTAVTQAGDRLLVEAALYPETSMQPNAIQPASGHCQFYVARQTAANLGISLTPGAIWTASGETWEALKAQLFQGAAVT